MNLREFLAVLWRRRLVILLLMAAGGGLVYLFGRPSTSDRVTYSGSTTLTNADEREIGADSVELFAFVANDTATIVDLVAADLGDDIAPPGANAADFLTATVSATTVPELGAVTIEAVDQLSETTAQAVLDRYSFHLIDYSYQRRQADHDAMLADLEEREGVLRDRVAELNEELDELRAEQTEEDRLARIDPDPVRTAEVNVALESLQTLLVEADQLRALDAEDLTPLAVASPPTVVTNEPAAAPLGLRDRVILGAALGAVLGIGLAFALQRLDTRLYGRKDTEAAFGLPVLAEIPRIAWRQRRSYQVITHSNPAAAASEAYRLLRSGLARARRMQVASVGDPRLGDTGTVTLVASAGERTGRSSTVANLAMAAIDAGKTALVISADLRKPTAHKFFGVRPGLGLTDAVDQIEERGPGSINLDLYVRRTNVEGVSVMLGGQPVTNPGERLAMIGPVIAQARQRFDLVFIDTPSMLVGNDVAELFPMTDLVLVVARDGETSIEEAQWTMEVAERAQAPVCGVVLIGSTSELQGGWRRRMRQSLRDNVRSTSGFALGEPAAYAGEDQYQLHEPSAETRSEPTIEMPALTQIAGSTVDESPSSPASEPAAIPATGIPETDTASDAVESTTPADPATDPSSLPPPPSPADAIAMDAQPAPPGPAEPDPVDATVNAAAANGADQPDPSPPSPADQLLDLPPSIAEQLLDLPPVRSTAPPEPTVTAAADDGAGPVGWSPPPAPSDPPPLTDEPSISEVDTAVADGSTSESNGTRDDTSSSKERVTAENGRASVESDPLSDADFLLDLIDEEVGPMLRHGADARPAGEDDVSTGNGSSPS